MDFTPAWLCARECLDCTLQRAVRARRTRLVPRRESVPAEKRLQRFKQAFRHFGLLQGLSVRFLCRQLRFCSKSLVRRSRW